MIVCGIDPGLTGALAVLNDHNDLQILDMPVLGEKAETVINGAMIARFLDDFDVEFVVLERSHARPGEGVSSSFRNGQVYGQLLGVIQTSLIPYVTVTAPVWKKAMHLSKDKNLSRLRAIQRFPDKSKLFERVMDHGRAEAALLALWQLEHGGEIKSTWRSAYKRERRGT